MEDQFQETRPMPVAQLSSVQDKLPPSSSSSPPNS